MDLTKITLKTGDGGTTVVYQSTTPAVSQTPPGVDRLYWNIGFSNGDQLFAKLVNSNWTVAEFDVNSGQTNFNIKPKIEGTTMTITYPVSLAEPFKWGSNTEYGATNYQDFCPEDYGTLRHG
jgi:stress response protein SCP2